MQTILDTPNYTLMDDKAYTEDNVLIYNIFVFNIPHKVGTIGTLHPINE